MRKIILFTSVFLAVSGLLSAQTTPSWQAKVAPSLLEETRHGETVPFIILLAAQADVSAARLLDSKEEKATFVFETLHQTAAATQGNIITFLKKHNAPAEALYIVNALRTKGDQALIQSIASRPEVARILSNPDVRFAEPVEWEPDHGQSRSAVEWGIERINADDVWALGYRGQHVVVGGEDTGYDWTHPALKKQYRGYDAAADTVDHNYNWHDAIHEISPLSADSINPCGLDSKVPCDDGSHGTHTMGTMIGEDSLNQIGVAPEARWCGCRNMERGWGSPFTYLECFQWFLAPTDLSNANPDPSKAPHVINNSWGCPAIEGCDSTNWILLDMAIQNLRLAGTVVVASAGNNGSGCSTVSVPPAMFEGAFTIGATAPNDTIAGFSSRGPVTSDGSNRLKPNVSAPGVFVRSSVPGDQYNFSSGTSMAGPHVAGLVALLISANPALAGKVDVIEDIIEQTAIPKTTDQQCGDVPGSEVPNHTYGYGRVDALAAVEAALAFEPVSTEVAGLSRNICVYPNPADDVLYIQLTEETGELVFELFDIQGRTCIRKNLPVNGRAQLKVDLSNVAVGLYVYRISTDEYHLAGKVVIQ
jgi:subtilisin family serine protease